VEKQNTQTPGTPGSDRQAEIAETLRKLKQNLTKRRSRAKDKEDEELVKWEVSFDLERLSKGGGLIDIHEVAPFADCETLQEYLSTTRKFAYAFRAEGQDCKDIQPGETINGFMLRVQKLWYSAPLGTVMHFVRLDNCEFDDDLGFSRAIPVDWSSDWTPTPGSLTAEEIAALPMVGKPEPEWKKEGFENWQKWNEHVQKKQKLKKDLEEFEKTLPTPEELERRLRTSTQQPTEGTPTLLYHGVIIEH